MKKIVFIVEKTNTGFSAYAEDFDKLPVGTTGKNVVELKANILSSLNTYFEHKAKPLVSAEVIRIKIDLPQFFDFYREINAKALSHRIHMNETLLSQYINGKKEPSEKQVSRILQGVRQLGKELTEIDFI